MNLKIVLKVFVTYDMLIKPSNAKLLNAIILIKMAMLLTFLN